MCQFQDPSAVCQNNNNLHDGERIRALRPYLSLSRISLKLILTRLVAVDLYGREKGNKLPWLIQALSWFLPSNVHTTTWLEGLQAGQSGCLMYFFSVNLNVNSRQSFSLMCGFKKTTLLETSSLGSTDIQAAGKVSPDFRKMHSVGEMSHSVSPDKASVISWQNSGHSGLLPTFTSQLVFYSFPYILSSKNSCNHLKTGEELKLHLSLFSAICYSTRFYF